MNYKAKNMKAGRPDAAPQGFNGSMDLLALSMPEMSPIRRKASNNRYNALAKTRSWNTPPVGLVTVQSDYGSNIPQAAPSTIERGYSTTEQDYPTTELANVVAKTEDLDQDLEFYHFLQASPRPTKASDMTDKSSKLTGVPMKKFKDYEAPIQAVSRDTSRESLQVSIMNNASPSIRTSQKVKRSDKELMTKLKAQSFQIVELESTVKELKETMVVLQSRIETLEKRPVLDHSQSLRPLGVVSPPVFSEHDSIQDADDASARLFNTPKAIHTPKKLVSILEMHPTKTTSDSVL